MAELLRQVSELKKHLRRANESLRTEKENRIKAESDCASYKRDMTELEQGLDYYQSKSETREENVRTLNIQLKEKEELCEVLQKRLKQESQIRVHQRVKNQEKDISNENLKKQISKLEEGLGFHQSEAESQHKRIMALEIQLQIKEGVCADLQKHLEDQPDLRRQLEDQQKNCCNKDLINQNFKKQIGELEKENTDLKTKMENFYPMKKKLDEVSAQLEEKSSLCVKLQECFNKEKQRRVQLEKKQQKKDASKEKLLIEMNELEQGLDYYQDVAETRLNRLQTLQKELQEKESLCEDLQERLNQQSLQLEPDFQHKDSAHQSLDKETGDLQKKNGDPMSKLQTMEDTETSLHRAITHLQLEKVRINEQHEEELEALRLQLQDRLCSELQAASEGSSPDTHLWGVWRQILLRIVRRTHTFVLRLKSVTSQNWLGLQVSTMTTLHLKRTVHRQSDTRRAFLFGDALKRL
ncbi:golgin IMH1-like [Nothobranchius furzeri]|uniref:Golgin IMH1-like n=1 Tax=Nothobranchius furzeri TaxID=105023 RepID=A0A9D2XPE4_NOTFU|nr:golgin IMH1-like [Nothobranchius furzeri]